MDVEKILQQMTLEEKIALCSGENFWQTKTFAQYGIPALFMCDGPHGLRKQENEADMLGVHESREDVYKRQPPYSCQTPARWKPLGRRR